MYPSYLLLNLSCVFGTVKSLINAHALINAHPPIWTLKMSFFFTFLTKIPASNKRPLEINGGKTILPTAVCFLIHCSIAKKYIKLLFHKLSYSKFIYL